MKTFAIITFGLAVSSCATISHGVSANNDVVSVCEVASQREALMERTVLVRGYIKRDHHGLYASGLECPKEYVWVVLRNREASEAMTTLLRSTFEQLDEPKEEIVFRARVALNDYRLPLTDHVSPRLSLEFISREGETQ